VKELIKFKCSMAIIYLRISSKEQEDGYSIAAQLRTIRLYAAKHGIIIVGEPIIEIASAKKVGRKKFDAMVTLLKKELRKVNGQGINSILTEKTDRLVRNHVDKETLLNLGVTIHLTKEHLVVHHNSPSVDLYMFDNSVSCASRYSRNLGEEASKGMHEKAEEGWYPSNAPLGYINTVRADEKKIIVPDPVYSDVVKKMFNYYATGKHSLTTLVTEINSEIKGAGLNRRLSKSTVAQILSNSIYAGTFNWKGKQYKGNHTPLITEDLYNKVQSILHNTNKHARQSRDKNRWLFQGLLFCGHCGCAIVAELKKKQYIYYHCTGNKGECPGKSVIEQGALLPDVINTLRHVVQANLPLEQFCKTVINSQADNRCQRDHNLARIAVEIDKDLQRQNELLIRSLDGKIDEGRFQKADAQLEHNIAENRSRFEKLETDNSGFIDNKLQLVELLDKAVELFQQPSRSDQEKRQLLRTFLGHCTLKDRRLHPILRPPFDQLVTLNKN
jgi:site-specific DNA recombinase